MVSLIKKLSDYKRFANKYSIRRNVSGESYEDLSAPGPLLKGFINTLIGLHAIDIARDGLKKAGMIK